MATSAEREQILRRMADQHVAEQGNRGRAARVQREVEESLRDWQIADQIMVEWEAAADRDHPEEREERERDRIQRWERALEQYSPNLPYMVDILVELERRYRIAKEYRWERERREQEFMNQQRRMEQEMEQEREQERLEAVAATQWRLEHPEEILIDKAVQAIQIRESDKITGRVDPFDVHNQAEILKGRISTIVDIIKKDLKTNKDYSNIGQFLDDTIGKYIKDPESKFNGKKSNSTIRTLEQWIGDYEKVKGALVTSALEGTKEEIGLVVDFAFKYNFHECYIIGFIYDNANAYNGADGHQLLSCFGGIIERNITTFRNCILGIEQHIEHVEGDVFDELKEALEATSWDTLDRTEQLTYDSDFRNFIIDWTAKWKENATIRSIEPKVLFEMLLIDYKDARYENPYFIIEHYREFYKDLGVEMERWDDYFDGKVTKNNNVNVGKTSNNNIKKFQNAQRAALMARRVVAAPAPAANTSGGRRHKRNTRKIKGNKNTKKIKKGKKVRTVKRKKSKTMKRRRGRRQ